MGSRPLRSPAAPALAKAPVSYSPFARTIATIGFALLLITNVALPTWKVAGFPDRGILAIVILGTLCLLCFDRTAAAYYRNKLLLGIVAGLAVVGIFVSLANGGDPAEIASQLMQVHLQTAVTIMVAATLASIAGPKPCIYVIVAVIGASGIVAVLQVLGVHQGWTWREALGSIVTDDQDAFDKAAARRPMGLSYSPIQLSTQLCLAFAAYTAWLDKSKRKPGTAPYADPAVVIALLVFLAVCVASGTRSPILGGGVFFALYSLTRRGSWLPVLVVLGGGFLYFAWPMVIALFEKTQPRMLTVTDNSADGHVTLAYYGLLLIRDNPLGYGLTFKPFEHWAQYWSVLYTMPSPGGTQSKQLHDYVLNMLTTYGIGLLLFVPWTVKLLAQARASLLFFVPYIIQILFHNSGPFWGDAIIWFVIAAVAAQETQAATRPAVRQPPRNAARPIRLQPLQSARPGTVFPHA
ncbi:O-antigen ligase/polysaccharide polymerase Wzy-like membrane protein [Sphingomonas sp. F9_3S_D5_B_2]